MTIDLAPLDSRIGATWSASGLSEGSLERLARLAREYEAPAGERLLREGDETEDKIIASELAAGI